MTSEPSNFQSTSRASIRLQRYLAQCGVASRRAGEKLIAEGRVTVNGRVVSQQGARVNPESDRIAVDGRLLRLERRLYIAAYKPRGCVCSARAPEGRPTVFDLLRRDPSFPQERLFTVGRLDYSSEGLLLLTNDGVWAQNIAHPQNNIRKTYRVWTHKMLDRHELARLRQGIVTPDGERLRLLTIRSQRLAGESFFYEVVLTEGRNRHIRRMFEALDISVRRLLRVQIGPLKLGALRPGEWRTLTEREVRMLGSGEPRFSRRQEVARVSARNDGRR